jgi:hypothetical protein
LTNLFLFTDLLPDPKAKPKYAFATPSPLPVSSKPSL